MVAREAFAAGIAVVAAGLGVWVWWAVRTDRLERDFGALMALVSAHIAVNSAADVLPGPEYVSWIAYGLASLLLLVVLRQTLVLAKKRRANSQRDST